MRFHYYEDLVFIELEKFTKIISNSFAGGPFGSNLKTCDYTTKGVPIIQLSNITEDYLNFSSRLIFTSEEKASELKANNAFPGDLIIAKMMPAGRACLATNQYSRYVLGSNAIRVALDISKCNPIFIREQINSPTIRKIISSKTAGSTRQRIGIPELKKIKLLVPSLEEQNKIGIFLKKLDDRIHTQNKIIEDLELFKNWIIHDFFNVSECKCQLKNLIFQTSERNKSLQINTVLSVSNKCGFIKQSEQFEDREIASENKSNYKIVYKNDFAYNPARINVGSIAKLENFERGIVSPMYICFRCDEKKMLPSYLKYYFLSSKFKIALIKKLEGSVRQCLQFDSLCNIEIYLPNIKEQSELVAKLDVLQLKLQKEKDILNLYKKQKAYLLQNMFI